MERRVDVGIGDGIAGWCGRGEGGGVGIGGLEWSRGRRVERWELGK